MIRRNIIWEKWEDKILKKHYATADQEDLKRMLKKNRRTWTAIRLHAEYPDGLNLKRKNLKHIYYTRREDAILRKHYPSSDWSKLLELLPNRTKISIEKRAYEGLNLRRTRGDKKWSAEELEILIAAINRESFLSIGEIVRFRKKLAKKLSRSHECINRKRRDLGLNWRIRKVGKLSEKAKRILHWVNPK